MSSISSAKAAAMLNNPKLPYYFAALLVAVAAGLLGLLTLEQIAREMMEILAIIAGASFFSGLSLLLSQARQPRSAPLIQINFNGRRLQKELGEIIDAEYTEVLDANRPVERDAYADDDLVMALAKVRIDIERQVRRLAQATGMIREDQRFELRRVLEALERSGKVPDVAITAIRDILPICNRAIHGDVIDPGDARNVIDIAREVMVILEGELMKKSMASYQ